MSFGEIDRVVSLGEDDFDLVSVHCLEHFHQEAAAAVGVLEHRRVVGTQGEIVLVVTTGQLVFFKEFDRFKVVSAKECRATEFYPKSRQFWQSPAEHQTIKEPRPLSPLNRDAEALGRRISFRVVDVGGATTGATEFGIAEVPCGESAVRAGRGGLFWTGNTITRN